MELFGLPHPRDILASAYEAFVFYFLHFVLQELQFFRILFGFDHGWYIYLPSQ